MMQDRTPTLLLPKNQRTQPTPPHVHKPTHTLEESTITISGIHPIIRPLLTGFLAGFACMPMFTSTLNWHSLLWTSFCLISMLLIWKLFPLITRPNVIPLVETYWQIRVIHIHQHDTTLYDLDWINNQHQIQSGRLYVSHHQLWLTNLSNQLIPSCRIGQES